jgi:hypothetical protein
MFSTRHELSCEAISRAKSIPFFYIFFSGRPFYFSPLHFLFEKISCHDDVLVLPIMYTVLCVISFSLTRFLLFFDSFSFRFFLSFSLQVSGSKLWQTERSCMCCQESGEREATVSLLCPKAAPGEPKLRRVNNNNNSLILEIVHFVVPA